MYDADSVESFDSFTDKAFCWQIYAFDRSMPALTGFRFIDHYFLEADDFYLTFLIECTYFSLAYYDAKLKHLATSMHPFARPHQMRSMRSALIA